MKSLSLLAATLMAGVQPASATQLYFGADLSFANQMADCGAVYRDSDGKAKDVYTIFKNHGANLCVCASGTTAIQANTVI